MTTLSMCTTLWCSACGDDTVHVVEYVGPYIKAITCSACQRTLARRTDQLRRQFVHDLPGRTRGLVRRTVRSASHHPKAFITHLPKNLVLKPLAISSELYGLLSETA